MNTESQEVSYRTQVALTIRAARTALGWSQEELAKRASISKPTIARIEMSGISPRADTLNTLMQVFKKQGVDVEMDADEVSIRYNKTALLTLQNLLNAK
jgi:transcriptional regulator with XRE-family HTH domain